MLPSDDICQWVVQGKSWSVIDISIDPTVPPTWLIEGALANSITGEWILAFRTSVGSLYSSYSKNGFDWTPARPTALPNPNSKVGFLIVFPLFSISSFAIKGLYLWVLEPG